jgi:chromosome segregation ATPase
LDPRKKELDALAADIARVELQIHSEFVSVGRIIAGLDRSVVRNPEMAKYVAGMETLRKSADTYRDDIARIRETAKRVETLDKEARESDEKIRSLTEERESRLVDLGAGCWTVYRGLADKTPYRSIFEEVSKFDTEAERVARDLADLEREERQGFFDKLKSFGAKLGKRSTISKLEKRKQDALIKALAASDFSRHATGDLALVFDFVADKQRSIAALAESAARARAEAAQLREALKKLGIDDDVDLRVRDFEKRIADVLRELEVMHGWAGQLFIEKDLRTEFADAGLGAKFEIVGGLRASIVRKREAIGRLRAEMELEELSKKEKALRAKRKAVEDELKQRERQISVLDLELNGAERRMAELKRVLAGETAFTEPAPPPSPDFYPR